MMSVSKNNIAYVNFLKENHLPMINFVETLKLNSDSTLMYLYYSLNMYIRGFTIFQTSRYQGIVKAAVSGVFVDLKFKISELSDQN